MYDESDYIVRLYFDRKGEINSKYLFFFIINTKIENPHLYLRYKGYKISGKEHGQYVVQLYYKNLEKEEKNKVTTKWMMRKLSKELIINNVKKNLIKI